MPSARQRTTTDVPDEKVMPLTPCTTTDAFAVEGSNDTSSSLFGSTRV